ncbi:exopolysaccharide biosynthesis protein [Ligilactobacillus equi]|uniref:glycosyltransferase family 32 protein n=1 Tax=Ligilactobacillus equi TaxID=137357 RepID=UPI002ED26C64
MIPKHIHYCWFGGKPLPRHVKKNIITWKKACPDYEITEWNESNFDVHAHPFMAQAYDQGQWAFVSDYARLQVIYEQGGIYLDTDVELLRNLDFLLENDFYAGMQQDIQKINTGLGYGAKKHSPVVKAMLAAYDGLVFDPQQKEALACPNLNTMAIESYQVQNKQTEKVRILPATYLDPIAPGDEVENLLTSETISIHHYLASWGTKQQQRRRRLISWLGQARVMKLRRWVLKNLRK